MRPSRWAMAAASVRLAAPSLPRILDTCTLAVFGAMNSTEAISLLLRPAAMSRSTSRSRLVSAVRTSPSARCSAVPIRARRARLDAGAGSEHHGGTGSVRLSGPVASLTEREREVLRLVAQGKSNREIAAELFIAPKTASVHVSNILGKLGVTSRGEAAALAYRQHLLNDR